MHETSQANIGILHLQVAQPQPTERLQIQAVGLHPARLPTAGPRRLCRNPASAKAIRWRTTHSSAIHRHRQYRKRDEDLQSRSETQGWRRVRVSQDSHVHRPVARATAHRQRCLTPPLDSGQPHAGTLARAQCNWRQRHLFVLRRRCQRRWRLPWHRPSLLSVWQCG